MQGSTAYCVGNVVEMKHYVLMRSRLKLREQVGSLCFYYIDQIYKHTYTRVCTLTSCLCTTEPQPRTNCMCAYQLYRRKWAQKVLLSGRVSKEQVLELLHTHTPSHTTFKWNFRPTAIEGNSHLIELSQSLGAEEEKEL